MKKKKEHSIYEVQYCLWFQASAGDLECIPADKGRLMYFCFLTKSFYAQFKWKESQAEQ